MSPLDSPLYVPGFIRLGPTHAAADGAIEGPVGLGLDVVGTVTDRHGAVTFEDHPVGGPTEPPAVISEVMRSLLLLAIPAYLESYVDEGWVTIRNDLLAIPGVPIHPDIASQPATIANLPASPPEAVAMLFRNGGGERERRETWPPRKIVPPPPIPAFQPANYIFELVSMRITNTRSRHEDTDRASASVAVGSQPAQTVTKDLGDHNNGTFALGMRVGPFAVSDPNIGIAANYLIVNSGHQDWNTVNGLLTKAGGELASAGAKAATAAVGSAIGASVGTGIMPVVGSVLGAIAGWLVGEVVAIITANCDGPVAAEQPAFKGIDLWNRTHNGTNSFGAETYHPGVDSASGCGSNSQYYVTWSLTRVT